jgi:leucyl aminopeptidase (aminopeptidase T)
MSANEFDLLRAAEVLLGGLMCVRRGEEVLVTADTKTDPRVAQAVFAAAERLGARAMVATGPQLPFQGKLADAFISKAQAQLVLTSDVWVDLTFPYFAGSHAHDEAMKTQRIRYMLGGDMDAGSFQRLFGRVDLDQYFEMQSAFDRVFTAGKRCRITAPGGTDVSFTLAKSALAKPRHADKPGMYVVPGTCSIAPDVPTVKGTIVVTHAFHEFYERLAAPITLAIDGPIRKVSGGGASRFPLERALLRAGGGKYGSIIHFAQGMHPAARVTGECFIEDIRAMGSNAIGLGIPWWEPGGGENHPDAVITEQTVWVEGEKIIEEGFVIAPSDLAKKAAGLAPTFPRGS